MMLAEKAVHIYFDGGCKRTLCAHGYIILDPKAKLLVAQGNTNDGRTNNQAEVQGLYRALDHYFSKFAHLHENV